MLTKTPGFTFIAVLTLTLGIGANSAIFSVIDSVLLRPLRFKDPNQLVQVWNVVQSGGNARASFSFADFYDYRAQSRSLKYLAYYGLADTVLSAGNEAQAVSGIVVGGDFFETLDQPILGRGFSAEEAKAGQPNVVVIGHGLWQRAFGGSSEIIGRQVTLTSRTYTILGVMAPGWKFPVGAQTTDFIMPWEPLEKNVTDRGSHIVKCVGRLNPGLSIQQAEPEFKAIAADLAQRYPATNASRTVMLVPLLEEVVANLRPALLVLLGAVALVLLIACTNVANLLLARAAARSHEIALRVALGASRAEIIRQLLVESFVLALIGGACGLLLAWAGVELVRVFGPPNVPRLSDARINLSVGAFTFGVAILSTLLFGLVPALKISRPDLTDSLQRAGKGASGGLHGARVRVALVVAQVSLSLLLLAGTGLLMRSFFNLQATDLGFDPSRLLMLYQFVPRAYSAPEKQRDFYGQLLPKLAAVPGVLSVGGATPPPFSDSDWNTSFRMENEPEGGPGTHPDAACASVTPNYFRTMRIPLRSGRDFADRDNENAPPIALVNETFVRRHVTKGDPIGQRILLDRASGPPEPVEIVGVVGDAKQNAVGAATKPAIYLPFAQAPNRRLWLVFRMATDNLSTLQASVRRLIQQEDRDIYVGNIEPMRNAIGRTLAQPRFHMVLLALFAAVATALATIGIYGVINYSVAQRTREIGIRMALGAQPRDMLGMIVRQSLMMLLLGIVIGLLAALGATRLLTSFLYGVGTTDFLTYAGVVVLLGSAGLAGSLIPARRAMRVDPIVALRAE